MPVRMINNIPEARDLLKLKGKLRLNFCNLKPMKKKIMAESAESRANGNHKS